MTALSIIIDVVLILVSLVLIIAVLMQEGQRQGLGAIGGGAETFFGKNTANSVEGKLKRITKILATVFIVLAIAATMITSHIIAPADDPADVAGVTEDTEGNPIVEELEDGSHVHEDGTVHDAEGNIVESEDAEETVDATEAPVEATEAPAEEATEAPTAEPTAEPTEAPTAEPTEAPTAEPTEEPAAEATAEA